MASIQPQHCAACGAACGAALMLFMGLLADMADMQCYSAGAVMFAAPFHDGMHVESKMVMCSRASDCHDRHGNQGMPWKSYSGMSPQAASMKPLVLLHVCRCIKAYKYT